VNHFDFEAQLGYFCTPTCIHFTSQRHKGIHENHFEKQKVAHIAAHSQESTSNTHRKASLTITGRLHFIQLIQHKRCAKLSAVEFKIVIAHLHHKWPKLLEWSMKLVFRNTCIDTSNATFTTKFWISSDTRVVQILHQLEMRHAHLATYKHIWSGANKLLAKGIQCTSRPKKYTTVVEAVQKSVHNANMKKQGSKI